MSQQHEHIFQRALLSSNPQAILRVASIFEELGEGNKAQLLLEHSNALMGGGFAFGSDHAAFGADYAAIQAKLNQLGANPPLVVDGSWGPKSKAALIAYQSAHGLTADGIPGPITLGSLGLSGPAGTPSVPTGPVTMPPSSNFPPGEVPNKMTPMTAEQASKAISDGYLLVTGKRPNAIILGLLIGQTALETGNWNSIHNFNFGNKKWSSQDKNWQFFRCSEVVDGVETFYDPPHPACKFAAYGSAAEGAAAYIRLLQSRPHWWNGLQSGTVDGFIAGLTTRPAYFTANPTQYRNVLAERMSHYTALATKYAGAAMGIGVGILLAVLGFGAFLFRKKLGF